ncbi:MAG: polysaccharide biosynthesis tyrosine autokinase [Prevotellaceae bacterium]|nr:polysaccharide biosynthesis tyrosine autokinase [Prevotellaceae bacterium]
MKSNQQTKKAQTLNTRDIEDYLILFLSHWYWFVISAAIAVSLAVIKVKRTTPTYVRKASLLIKDLSQSNSTINDLSSMGIVNYRSDINNEIQTISAPMIMEEVVRRLCLNVELSIEESLHMRPLYNEAPVALTFENPEEGNALFTMKLGNGREVLLYDFVVGGKKLDKTFKTRIGSTVSTPAGRIHIASTPSFDIFNRKKEIYVRKTSAKSIARSYSARFRASSSKDESSIINLSVVDASPSRASDIITTLIDVYNENWLKDKNAVAESTIQFINERLLTISGELESADNSVSDFKSSHLMLDGSSQASRYFSQNVRSQDEYIELSNQLSIIRYLDEYINDNSSQNQILPVNSGLTNLGTISLIENYNRILSERNRLLKNSSEENAIVKEMTEELAITKSSLARSLKNLIQQYERRIANIQSVERNTSSQMASAPYRSQQLVSIERQQKVKEQLYIYLLQKREESEISKSFTASNSRLIQPPMGTDVPIEPEKSKTYAIFFAIGLAIPSVLLYIKETLNTKVRGRKDLEATDVPFIGEIPQLTQKKHWWQKSRKLTGLEQIVVKENSKNLVNEAFRIVRTKLDYFAGKQDKAQIIMITSFNPGSGKTFITANLARAIALKNKKVLCIDFDMRRASLSKIIGRPKHGLTSYLSGRNEDIDSLIVRDVFGGGVDLLPVGVIPPNPSELLLSENTKVLIESMRNGYDVILLDCPPYEIVADTNIIKEYADLSIFVVRAGLMERHLLKEIENFYLEGQFRNMALMLNGADFVSGRYGSYRYGYHRYGYAYGYGYGSYDGYITKK